MTFPYAIITLYSTMLSNNKLERDIQISKAQFNKSERKLDNRLDDRFG